MRQFLAVPVLIAVAACDVPTEPEVVLEGDLELLGAASALTAIEEAAWQSLPWSYTVSGSDCAVTLDRGSLEVRGATYTLVLEHETECPDVMPERIEEHGRIAMTGSTAEFHVDGGGCGSWIFQGHVQDDELHAEVVHPCLHGAGRYLRFVSNR